MAIGKEINDQDTRDKESVAIFQPFFSLDDLILSESTLNSISDFVEYEKNEHLIFEKWGLSKTHKDKRVRAINLFGPSGTGKSMAAHAIAHTLGKRILIANYADIESKYVGETSKNITNLFKKAEKEQAVLFLDEADAILSRRVTNMTSSSDVSVNQTRSVILMLMNRYTGLVIFATNFLENYDSAFMRRILMHVEFHSPDLQSRVKLWKKYIPEEMPCNASILELAEASDGLTGSDISNCVLRTAIYAARTEMSVISFLEFSNIISEIKKGKNINGSVAQYSVTSRECSDEEIPYKLIREKNK